MIGVRMEIGHKFIDDIMIINLFGELYSEKTTFLEFKLNNLVNQAEKFILNFEDLEYIDSKGLGIIIKVYQSVCDKKGNLVIASPYGKVKKVLQLTKFERFIKIFDSLDLALDFYR